MAAKTPDTKTREAAPGSLRELLHVAFPLVVSSGSLSLMTVVDRIFLANLSVNALAASMPAVMLSWTSMSLAFGLTSYTGAFVSQYEGAGRKDRVAASVWQGLFVAVLGGVLLLPLIPLSPMIFRWMGHTPEVRTLEVQFFTVICPVAIPMLVSTVLSAFFTCRRRTDVVMWVNIGTSLLNIVLDWLLIFGHFGFPRLEVRGAALATLISTAVGAVVLSWLLALEARRQGYPFRSTFGVDVELLVRMMRYGLPNGVQMLLDVGAFTVFVAFVGQLGTVEQAATNLAFTLNSLAFIPLIGMGNAVLSLVGIRIGEGEPDLAARTVWKAFALSGGYMIVFAIIYLSLPDVILYPFLHGSERESFESMRPLVISLLKFVALYTFFDAMVTVFGSAVRGAGDTFFSLYFTVACAWLLMVMPTWWLLQHGGSLYACWSAVTAFVMVLGVGLLLRFLQGRWRTMRVIEHGPLIAEP